MVDDACAGGRRRRRNAHTSQLFTLLNMTCTMNVLLVLQQHPAPPVAAVGSRKQEAGSRKQEAEPHAARRRPHAVCDAAYLYAPSAHGVLWHVAAPSSAAPATADPIINHPQLVVALPSTSSSPSAKEPVIAHLAPPQLALPQALHWHWRPSPARPDRQTDPDQITFGALLSLQARNRMELLGLNTAL